MGQEQRFWLQVIPSVPAHLQSLITGAHARPGAPETQRFPLERNISVHHHTWAGSPLSPCYASFSASVSCTRKDAIKGEGPALW